MSDETVTEKEATEEVARAFGASLREVQDVATRAGQNEQQGDEGSFHDLLGENANTALMTNPARG